MVCGPITLGIFILLLVVFISINFKVETIQRMPIISGFLGGMFELKEEDTTNINCGVDLPSCKENMRCVNGFCRTENIPSLKQTGLNIVP